MAKSHIPVPATTPDVKRLFQQTRLDTNNNKFWNAEWWDTGNNTGIMRTTYGRVGVTTDQSSKHATRSQFEKIISDKVKDGYKEIDLAVTTAPAVIASGTYHPRIEWLVNDAMRTAGEAVKKVLSVKVEQMSQSQIDQGRTLLRLAQEHHTKGGLANKASLRHVVQAYYNAIPTKLPPKIDTASVLQAFVADFARHSDHLDQLEAELANLKYVAGNSVGSAQTPFDMLAQQFDVVDLHSQDAQSIIADIATGMVHGYKVKVRDIFSLTVPHERAEYEKETFGDSNIRRLYHGTRAANGVHILRGGLKIMPVVANGSMFGRGLYFACQASKSTNYCAPGAGGLSYLFITEVKLGKQYIAPQGQHFNEAPHGYHSVWGKQGQTQTWSGGKLVNHEYIIYRQAQQTLKYLVTFER